MGRYIQFVAMHDTEKTYLIDLLQSVPFRGDSDISDLAITGITADSRKVRPGHLFIAVTGHAVDGHRYIPDAEARGCAAVLVQKDRMPPTVKTNVATIEVDDSRTALGLVAANYYGHPAREMRMIGITGTNGKTTTAYLVEAIIGATGRPGVIGTINYRYLSQDDEQIDLEAELTTPDPITLHRLLRRMASAGVTHVVMEVSSHALEQKRLAGLSFDIAVFTNLSRDHLDFHGNMETYFNCKKMLFCEHLKTDGQAVVILEPPASTAVDRPDGPDSDWGQRLRAVLDSLATTLRARVVTGGLTGPCDIYPKSFSSDLDGITAEIVSPPGILHLNSPLVGAFNLKNLLAAIGVGICLELDARQLEGVLTAVNGIPGRLERLQSKAGGYVFVDYAHTPDALENVLTTLRSLKPVRLICVFGCGGDRDIGKRALMGKVAGRLCDVVLATTDNPRTEDPQKILIDIEQGLQASPLSRVAADTLFGEQKKGYDIISSRRQAIETAVRHLRSGEVVVVAGKGHEDYQLTDTGKHFFDDRIEVKKHLNGECPC
jgi:UDP-N-acetylmuramyl-tripeptide synthetase